MKVAKTRCKQRGAGTIRVSENESRRIEVMALHCQVKGYGGVPTVHVNGKPLLLMANKHNIRKSRYYRDFHQAGYFAHYSNIKIQRVWKAPDTYDFSEFDEAIQCILNADPTGLILLELHANAPRWWEERYPDELFLGADGATHGQSMASRLWLEQQGETIRRCVKYVEKAYGDNVIAYFVGAGNTWEWFNRTPVAYITDHSKPMREAFVRWVRAKYNNDIDRLRKAWARDDITFEQISIPTKAEELDTDVGSFRDPRKRGGIVDFWNFIVHVMVEDIEYYAKVVKEATKHQKLFGVFYGQTLDWLSNPVTAQHTGHFGLSKLLESPNVDIILGPPSYMDRSIGSEAYFVSVTDSIKLHGKLWISEVDTRTYLAHPIQAFCGRPDTLEDSLTVLKRDFANALLRGVDMVWFSLFEGWYDHPEIMNFMAKAREIGNKAFRLDRGSVAEVAMIVDEPSVFYQGLRDCYVVDHFISREPRARDLVSRMATPYDMYLLSDLQDERTQGYKMYVFLNAFYITEAERCIIRERLQCGNKTLVWIYATGFIKDDSLSVANMEAVTGIKLALNPVSSDVFIRLSNYDDPITRGTFNAGNVLPTWSRPDLHDGFGVNKAVGPIFYVTDSEAVPLGRYTCDGRLGCVVKRFQDWSSVFVGTPFVPPVLLRKIARAAGVHLYLDEREKMSATKMGEAQAGWGEDIYNFADDILYANRFFLALHSRFAGRREILLPEAVDVYDVFNDRIIEERATGFTVDYPAKFTALYYIGEKPWPEV